MRWLLIPTSKGYWEFTISGMLLLKNMKVASSSSVNCVIDNHLALSFFLSFGFNVVNEESEVLVVFEAVIDLMSYTDIHMDFESNKLALGMLSDAPLETFLKEHPQISSLRFCLDNDIPERKSTEELTEKYYGLGYDVEDCPPPANYKDYNEWLVAVKIQPIRNEKSLIRGGNSVGK
jgi:hypothetical protein